MGRSGFTCFRVVTLVPLVVLGAWDYKKTEKKVNASGFRAHRV